MVNFLFGRIGEKEYLCALSRHDLCMLISFIITHYNLPADMLSECIDSILELSPNANEREIILVDDGSDSVPFPIVNAYKDDIIYVRQPNAGLSEARNTGIRLAQGKWIQFVDGDDKLVAKAYEKCLDIARYMDKADLISFEMTDKMEKSAIDYETPQVVSGVELMRNNNIKATACGYLFKKKTLSELRFRPGIFHEDEEFTPQLLLRAEFVYQTKNIAYLYRKREQSITNNKNIRCKLKRLNDTKDIIIRLRTLADSLPAEESVALQRRVAQLTMDYIYKVIVETRNSHYLTKELEALHAKGLYPLPDRNYTQKYTWFRKMIGSRLGRAVLMNVLPLMKE